MKVASETSDFFQGNQPDEGQKLAKSIDDRLSKELVFAMVGPVGSGCSTVAIEIKQELELKYKFTVSETISASNIIKESISKIGMSPPKKTDITTYVTEMQNAGNALREKYGEDYLSKKIVEKIHNERKRLGGFNDGKVLPKRIAYIVDSIKNQDELKLLRKIYKETLVLVGVFAPVNQRRKRLKIEVDESSSIKNFFERDQGEKESFGQATRKVFTRSDFFVCNDKSLDDVRESVQRFLRLCFNIGVNTPTKAEAAMYKANAVAGNSACLSRQVGAAIVSQKGEFIGVGWNDVPKFGGGLYDEDGRVESGIDNRCYRWKGAGLCHNEDTRHNILDQIADMLSKSEFVKARTKLLDIRNYLSDTPIDALIEFSRSIHAEMEAILSVGREGKHSLVGSTLYTNTYPCHNCARHIVASGIKKVVYIEPYLKSHAVKLHSDAITEDPQEKEGKVFFQQFDGVAPQNYLKFFRPEAERKGVRGIFAPEEPSTALPVLKVQLDSFSRYEDFVMASLLSIEKSEVENEGKH